MASRHLQQRNTVVEWGDVKRKFLEVVGDGKPWVGANSIHHTVRDFVSAGRNPEPLKCDHDCRVTRGEDRSCEHQRHGNERYWNEEKLSRVFNEKTKSYEMKKVPGWDERRTQPCGYCVAKGATHWSGAMYSETLHYLREGYRAPEFLHSAAYVPMAEKKRPTWDEEPDGDLDIGRLYGGYDNPYLVPSEQEKKPGLRIQIEYAFACGVSSKVIEQYGAWVAGLLGALESTGYDLTVDMWIALDGLFTDRHQRENVLIRVKRPNEVSNFTEWSAVFSPGGYRHVGFCAKLVAGDKIGSVCDSGLGTTLGGQTWRLEYDKEESILKVGCDQRGGGMYGGDAFPKDKLNKEAVALGLIPEAVKQHA